MQGLLKNKKQAMGSLKRNQCLSTMRIRQITAILRQAS
jgi:hypothetical protein